jgi:hypothetical protein
VQPQLVGPQGLAEKTEATAQGHLDIETATDCQGHFAEKIALVDWHVPFPIPFRPSYFVYTTAFTK